YGSIRHPLMVVSCLQYVESVARRGFLWSDSPSGIIVPRLRAAADAWQDGRTMTRSGARPARAPQVFKGVRDLLPQQMLLRQHVIATFRGVFERYGFEPIETPVMEYLEVLTGKYGEDEKLIYHFEDRGGREVGLRYDLT